MALALAAGGGVGVVKMMVNDNSHILCRDMAVSVLWGSSAHFFFVVALPAGVFGFAVALGFAALASVTVFVLPAIELILPWACTLLAPCRAAVAPVYHAGRG